MRLSYPGISGDIGVIPAYGCRTWENTKRPRSGLLGGRQLGHVTQIGRDARCRLSGHHLFGYLHRFLGLTENCQTKCARAEAGGIAVLQHRQKRSFEPGLVARNCLTKSKVPRDLIVRTIGDRQTIELLCAGRIAYQIESKPAISCHHCLLNSATFCIGIQAQRFDRTARIGICTCQPQRNAGIGRRNVLCPTEKANRGRNIPQFERGIARIDKRLDVAAVLREALKRRAKLNRSRWRQWLDDFLCKRAWPACRKCG